MLRTGRGAGCRRGGAGSGNSPLCAGFQEGIPGKGGGLLSGRIFKWKDTQSLYCL